MNLGGDTRRVASVAGSGTLYFVTPWVIVGAIFFWPPTRCLSRIVSLHFLMLFFFVTGVDNPRVKREEYAVNKSEKITISLDERIPREVLPLSRFRWSRPDHGVSLYVW